MAFDRPPILTGDTKRDLVNMRDYLFRMAGSLDSVEGGSGNALAVSYQNGKQTVKSTAGNSADIEAVRRNAQELRSLIIKTAKDVDREAANREAGDATVESVVKSYTDSKVEVYNGLYVSKSEYGEFTESIGTTIENTARGIVESYDYDSAIQSVQDGISLVQNYYTDITGEIQRGIVLDPDTNEYVTGIAISQNLQFSGECGPSDQHNPGDGFTYWYLTSGQTFGLYTSTGWQFWIDGAKVGWCDSLDGMLHVKTVYVEEKIIVGGSWDQKTETINGAKMLTINYVGG